MMQSDGQLSWFSVLPSSQVSLPETLPLPHAGSVQLASQPSMFLVLQKPPGQSAVVVHVSPSFAPPEQVSGVSHVSCGGVTVPLPQSVQKPVQPSPSLALPSSHSSPASINSCPQGLMVVVVVLVTVVVVVVLPEGQASPSARGTQTYVSLSLSFRVFSVPASLFFFICAAGFTVPLPFFAPFLVS